MPVTYQILYAPPPPPQPSAPPPLDRKERREFRKSQRPHSALIGETKIIWEKLRRHDLKDDDKKAVMEKLMGLLSGHMHEVTSTVSHTHCHTPFPPHSCR